MPLNNAKCNTVTFTRRKSQLSYCYFLNDVPINSASSYKYLGVHVTSNLSWTKHIETISAEASRTLGYIKRNIKLGPPHLRQLAYETYVRPKLEYAAAIWNPNQQYLTNHLEAI